jgi:hypothetical protein
MLYQIIEVKQRYAGIRCALGSNPIGSKSCVPYTVKIIGGDFHLYWWSVYATFKVEARSEFFKVEFTTQAYYHPEVGETTLYERWNLPPRHEVGETTLF